jgi:mannan endo-1,4-beta-mannosidase
MLVRILKILLLLPALSLNAQDKLVDPDATARTRALYANMQRVSSQKQVLFGHQDDLAYGVGWRETSGGSDVRYACGDYPAVYGWELGNLEKDVAHNLDSVHFGKMKKWIREGYKRGGIITLSWHISNYHTGGSAWDTTAAVRDILPGGVHHDRYKADLDRFARFANDLKTGSIFSKDFIPVIFRPFHEHTGSWFWWGRDHTTPEDFKSLWKFTVKYLRDEKQLHHLIYAFSTSYNYTNEDEMLEFYPGDEWADILGIDFYAYDNQPETWKKYVKCQDILINSAQKRSKIPALTEFGYEGIPQPDWWTKVLLPHLSTAGSRTVAYACAWRNANTKHHYVPYAGHASTPDFQEFYRHDTTLFEGDLWNFYKEPPEVKAAAGNRSRSQTGQ